MCALVGKLTTLTPETVSLEPSTHRLGILLVSVPSPLDCTEETDVHIQLHLDFIMWALGTQTHPLPLLIELSLQVPEPKIFNAITISIFKRI